MPLDVDTVLVPVDGGEASANAAEYAVAIAERYDASLHTLFVVGEQVSRRVESGELSEDAVAAESEAFAEDVRAIAEDRVAVDFSAAFGFSTRRKMTHPGSVILDAADDVDADFIVVPREAASGGSGTVLEKAAEYVLLYASQPVLSV